MKFPLDMKLPFELPIAFGAFAHEIRSDTKKLMLSWRDFAGITASLACAIHCAAMPLVIAYLPAMGLTWMVGEGFHQAMAVLCIMIALAAFVPGWRKHRRPSPVMFGMTGLALLMMAAFMMEPCCPPAQAATPGGDAAVCQHCDSCKTECASTEETTLLSAGMIAPIVPWVTPLGGMLLVIAHLLNHRFACRCCRREKARTVTGIRSIFSTSQSP